MLHYRLALTTPRGKQFQSFIYILLKLFNLRKLIDIHWRGTNSQFAARLGQKVVRATRVSPLKGRKANCKPTDGPTQRLV